MQRLFAPMLVLAMSVAGCGGIDGNGDADNDGISNADEGMAANIDTDSDGFEDWLDLDTDQDGVPDALEAGDTNLASPPVDTDGDGVADFRDSDADGDGIADIDELGPDAQVIDTDQDGVRDFQDTDSDGDLIPDSVELGYDSDGDGVPDRRSLDSDGDCIPDAIEAGPDANFPAHSDGDGLPDYRDPDSDGDGLPDAREDRNCDGNLDADESSPTSTDTDNDGTLDLVEEVAGSNPNDPTDTIPEGDFYFVLPYNEPGQEAPLDFATSIRQADIFFSVDTTGSFGEEIAAIQAELESTIVPGVSAIIPDAAFGVGRFEDFPLEPFGLAGDVPFALLQPITTVIADIGAALASLAPAAGGLDVPEAGYEALYQWATGVGFADFGYLPFAPPGIGGVGFRDNALPIIIQVTDARSHDPQDYPFAGSAHSRDDVAGALTALGIRVIGVNSLENQGTADDPGAQLQDLAITTNAVIPPDGSDTCATGVAGALRPAVDIGGTLGCPLVFDVLPDGTGLGSLIVDSIAQLAQYGTLDISTAPVGQTVGLQGEVVPPGHTTADFLTAITPVAPAPQGATIDGDVFRGVTAGSVVTFDVQAYNDFVPPINDVQLFAIDINILGDAVTLLDVRRVFVVVPERPVIIE